MERIKRIKRMKRGPKFTDLSLKEVIKCLEDHTLPEGLMRFRHNAEFNDFVGYNQTVRFAVYTQTSLGVFELPIQDSDNSDFTIQIESDEKNPEVQRLSNFLKDQGRDTNVYGSWIFSITENLLSEPENFIDDWFLVDPKFKIPEKFGNFENSEMSKNSEMSENLKTLYSSNGQYFVEIRPEEFNLKEFAIIRHYYGQLELVPREFVENADALDGEELKALLSN